MTLCLRQQQHVDDSDRNHVARLVGRPVVTAAQGDKSSDLDLDERQPPPENRQQGWQVAAAVAVTEEERAAA